jgi:hypothetical protein
VALVLYSVFLRVRAIELDSEALKAAGLSACATIMAVGYPIHIADTLQMAVVLNA